MTDHKRRPLRGAAVHVEQWGPREGEKLRGIVWRIEHHDDTARVYIERAGHVFWLDGRRSPAIRRELASRVPEVGEQVL